MVSMLSFLRACSCVFLRDERCLVSGSVGFIVFSILCALRVVGCFFI